MAIETGWAAGGATSRAQRVLAFGLTAVAVAAAAEAWWRPGVPYRLLSLLALLSVGVLAVNSILYRRLVERWHAHLGALQRASELAAIVEHSEDAIIGLSLDGTVRSWNGAAVRMYGYSPEEALGHRVCDLIVPPGGKREYEQNLSRLLRGERLESFETLRHRKDGTGIHVCVTAFAIRDERGQIIAFSSCARDITAQKKVEERLAYQALHDPLTSLPNRLLLTDRLERALAYARRAERSVAVLFLDLDRFKLVNDSLGHDAGDGLLMEVAGRLSGAVRGSDSVARLGGDEFVVLCEDLLGDAAGAEAEAVAVANRLRQSLAAPFTLAGREIFVTASIGIAMGGGHEPPDSLLAEADAAMYRAKERGRARWVLSEEPLRAQATERLQLERDLRLAVQRDEFRVLFQPTYEIVTGRIVGVEALVRWEHPHRGLLTPAAFLDVAEETGLIVPIGTEVLEVACRQLLAWDEAVGPLNQLGMAVNVSGRQLAQGNLPDVVRRVLAETGIAPRRLHLEITESMLIDAGEGTVEHLDAIKAMGVGLAIDDFGTRYSSLTYLRRFPVNMVKVDQSFVSGLDTNPADRAIVAAVIGLGRSLGLTTVAEGVETAEQLSQLRLLGCDRAQGFHLSTPRPAEEITELLAGSLKETAATR